ncbi:MAG: hypothetical protein GXP29_01440 [Planctomycetes bacterium]|nr:hypothetical protein [Planctomycetota bacterium]
MIRRHINTNLARQHGPKATANKDADVAKRNVKGVMSIAAWALSTNPRDNTASDTPAKDATIAADTLQPEIACAESCRVGLGRDMAGFMPLI